ncbi:MAG: acyl-CoA dehydrogenase [Myxococcales bacterium]|nr:acyl-CoA dehydrogenase [Myxococcales bacterium]
MRRPPAEAALVLGTVADRLGWAFAGGYLAALNALLPDRDPSRTAALCATEAAGVHPKAIATSFADGAVDGEKTFVTLAGAAEDLLVLAKEGEDPEGRPRLVLVKVDAAAPGVARTTLPATPFVPEIEHASVRFDGAPATRLPGDGWADYVRPFRTVEDIHVHLSALAFAVAHGRRHDAVRPPVVEIALAQITALSQLATEDPSSPATHLALAAVIDASAGVIDGVDLDALPEDERARWQRDRALFGVAGKARAQRRARAWERLARAAGEAAAS